MNKFEIVEDDDKCLRHPMSKFLQVESEDGCLTLWCLECALQALELDKGLWDWDITEEKIKEDLENGKGTEAEKES